MSTLELPEAEGPAPAVVAEGRGFTRAAFLKAGGALVIGVALPSSAQAAIGGKSEKQQARTVSDFPTVDPSKLKSWLAIQADGTVTAFTGKVDLGQGNQTAIGQIISEELDVPFASVTLVMGDTARCVDQGVTADSSTIIAGGPQLRQAAADGRHALIAMAADELGVPAARLTVRDGVVSDQSDSSKHISYGTLVKGRVLTQMIPARTDPTTETLTVGGVKTKPASEYAIVGRSVARVDIPLKVKPEYEYVQDVKVAGMLHGRVIRPPALGANLISHGAPPAGVKVVRQKDFLAVAAADEWTAIQAAQTLSTKWTSWSGLPSMDKLPEYLRGLPSQPMVIQHAGDIKRGLNGASRTLKASYDTPVETHGTLGPSCAIADVRSHYAEIYAGTQGPNLVQASVASVVGLKSEHVRVIAYPASGCYGRNGADPVAVDAAIMSKHLGVPVRVQWMRADEHGWDPKGPATAHDLRAGLDPDGKLVAWDHQGWIPAQFNTTIIGSVLAGGPVAEPVQRGGWAGNLPYDVPNVRLLSHNLPDIAAEKNDGVGIISAWLRSPAQFQITFAQESFIDEVAAAINADPLEFRLRHFTDKRYIAAFKHVAKMASWESRPSPRPQAHETGRYVTGRGIAGSLRSGTYNAEVAEVVVDRHTGKVTVTKIWAAQDNGLTINPQAVILGAEAGIVQSVSRTLLEEVTFNHSAITSLDWVSYPILRFEEAPEVNVELIGSQHNPPGGSGEPACCPVPAAIGNAIFDASRARLRTLPMTPSRVVKALEAA
jgi:nicotinate dehydrogenase subunit B